MDGLAQDLRYALRGVRRTPVFSAVAIACLAVGIGVNAAAFSILNALLVRDLPGVERQNEITTFRLSYETRWGRMGPGNFSPVDWMAFRSGMPALQSAGVVGNTSVPLRVGGEPVAVRADFVSGGFFRTLGTRPAIGRLITDDDDRPGAAPVVVIGNGYWRDEFDSSPRVLGSPLYIGNTAFTIVGVAPPGYVGLYPGELTADPEFGAPFAIVPLSAAPLIRAASRYSKESEALDDHWLVMAGRRRSGVTSSQAEAQATAIATRIAAAHPSERKNASVVARAPTTASNAETIAGFAFVMVIPVLILLVACANLANQLLARGIQRSREVAVRLSLGATRGRLVRLLLAEAFLLALAASVAGLLLARLLTDSLRLFALVLPFHVPLDFRVVTFTIALALVTALAFGLAPSLRTAGVDLSQAMKEASRFGSYRRSRLRSALVVVQVSASVALLALAGVFVRASQRSGVTDAGENPDGLLTVTTDLDLLGYSRSNGLAFQTRAMECLKGLPSVAAVAMAPFSPADMPPDAPVSVAGDARGDERWARVGFVSGDWFAARSMHPVVGRLFDEAEAKRGAVVSVIDEVAARRFWPNANPVGQVLRIGDDSSALVTTVIGVVPEMRRDRRDSYLKGFIMVPNPGRYDSRARFYVRTRGDARQARHDVRAVFRDLDPRLPVASMMTLGESLEAAAVDVTQLASGVGVMGTIALLLSALGLSAVLAFIVEQRRHEIGIRIALGARTGAVTSMIVRESFTLAVIGSVIGTLVAAATAVLLRSMLFGLPPIDPVAFSASIAVLLGVALLASAAPARKAAMTDPVVTLRSD